MLHTAFLHKLAFIHLFEINKNEKNEKKRLLLP